jgi:polysaccharide export outer membrane protein
LSVPLFWQGETRTLSLCFNSLLGGKMTRRKFHRPFLGAAVLMFAACLTAACTSLPVADASTATGSYDGEYVIGPGDMLEVFVWHNPELSIKAPVRPDGRMSIPLVEDIACAGKTPTELARDIEQRLAKFVNSPVVTVIVNDFNGPYSSQVRVVGEATKPHAIAYRQGMTVLDAMIAVGGLSPYAAGNRTVLVRRVNGKQESLRIRLDDLLKDGDISANVALRPGDIIIVPQSYF